jgi:hypothetical protein
MIQEQLSQAIQEVIDGNADPLEVWGFLKTIEKHVEACKKEIEPIVMAEADKYPEKSFNHKGMTFTRVEGRAMYKFDHLPMWNALNDERKYLEEKAKAAAKNVQIGATMVTEDGEVIDPAIITYTKPSLSVKL